MLIDELSKANIEALKARDQVARAIYSVLLSKYKALDIENKSLTHRPDCFGMIGFAREVAGILGETFTETEYFQKTKAKRYYNLL